MRFLLDESADARIGTYLRRQGHDVTGIVPDHSAGMSDEEVPAVAVCEERILITRDLDFGRLVFVDRHPHAGVILLRLGAASSLLVTTDRLDDVLTNHADDLDRFLVVTRHLVRVR